MGLADTIRRRKSQYVRVPDKSFLASTFSPPTRALSTDLGGDAFAVNLDFALVTDIGLMPETLIAYDVRVTSHLSHNPQRFIVHQISSRSRAYLQWQKNFVTASRSRSTPREDSPEYRFFALGYDSSNLRTRRELAIVSERRQNLS
jgi:hypothetical protein